MPTLGARHRIPASLFAASAVLVTLAGPGRAHAYTLKTTSSGANVRWFAPAVALELVYVGEPTMSRADAHAALAMAASAWRAVPGAPALVVRDATRDAASWGYDGVNGVYVLERWPFGDSRLAVTISTRREDTGELLDADILVNGEMAFGLSSGEHGADRFDLPLVLTHELGHVLGLDESEVPEATMWPNIRSGEIDRRELSADDVDGALALYGGEPARSSARYGCSVPRAGSVGTSGYGSALVVLAIVAAWRRRHARS